MRGARRLAEAVLPLSIAAAALALLTPSAWVAGRADLLLAALVALTALGIRPADLAAIGRRAPLVLALAVAPFVVLVPLAWLLSRLFDGPVRDGVLVLGLAPTEVATAGLVALATGEAALALAVIACSLVVSAVAGRCSSSRWPTAPMRTVAPCSGASRSSSSCRSRSASPPRCSSSRWPTAPMRTVAPCSGASRSSSSCRSRSASPPAPASRASPGPTRR